MRAAFIATLTLLTAGTSLAPVAAQEFVISERPALPHPTSLTFSMQGFDGPGTFGEVTSFAIKPLDGLPGFGVEVFADAARTEEALAAQAEFFGDLMNVSEAIKMASIEESQCGPNDESQHVEFYNGNGLVPARSSIPTSRSPSSCNGANPSRSSIRI